MDQEVLSLILRVVIFAWCLCAEFLKVKPKGKKGDLEEEDFIDDDAARERLDKNKHKKKVSTRVM